MTIYQYAEQFHRLGDEIPVADNVYDVLFYAYPEKDGAEDEDLFFRASDKLYKILIQGGSWKTILGGLWVTVQISLFALVIGTVLGAAICLLRTRKNPIARGVASVYIAVLRGTPVLMLLLLLYYGILARVGIAPVMVAVITFTTEKSMSRSPCNRGAAAPAKPGPRDGTNRFQKTKSVQNTY